MLCGSLRKPLLRAVANDETGAIVIVDRASGRVYAPHDGGALVLSRTGHLQTVAYFEREDDVTPGRTAVESVGQG